MPKNTTPCPRPGLEPGPLAPESSALTMRPPRLPPYRALLANIIMECQRWPEKPFILERSGNLYVAMVTKRFSVYCGAHKNWLRYLFSSCLIKIWWNRELTLKCKLKCFVKPMKDPLGVSPSKGDQGTTRGKEKILLTSVGIEPTTSGLGYSAD